MTVKSTDQVVKELRSEGFNVRRSYVQFLIRDSWIPIPPKVGSAHLWEDVHVEALKSELRRRGRWDPSSGQPKGREHRA